MARQGLTVCVFLRRNQLFEELRIRGSPLRLNQLFEALRIGGSHEGSPILLLLLRPLCHRLLLLLLLLR